MPPVYMTFPPLSMVSAHLLALLFASSYVGSLYVSKNARLRFSSETQSASRRHQVQPGSRDDPSVIRARLLAVTIASIFSYAVVYAIVSASTVPSSNYAFAKTLEILGINWSPNMFAYVQTSILFLGPLYASGLAAKLPGQSNFSFQKDFIDVFVTWVGFRNYFWAPLTEEVVFRACILAAYALGGATRLNMIMFTPLAFGLAHVHHAWDIYNRYGRTQQAAKRAVLTSLFQTAYTTLFGAHTSFLFLRTSSILPPVVAHIFCNIMGLPQFSDEIRQFPQYKSSIIIAYILRVVLFISTLWSWTAVEDSLYWSDPAVFWRTVQRVSS